MAQAYLPAGLTTCLVLSFAWMQPAFAGPDHIGAERCGACHQAQYQSWRKSPHAHALARLTESQQADPVCRSCHTMDPWSKDAALAGVQCESCHGAGRAYAPDYVMRDNVLSKLMGLKEIKESTCLPCHRADAPRLRPFNYAELVKLVMHPKPAPEAAQARPPKK